jgi:D-hydroxyproline dehydrogenase subunit beta
VDAVVIGAGVVGAACAYYLSAAGATVTVVDRGSVAGGTSGAGEGNILVSDKELGPELELALCSGRLWRELARELDADIELEFKGGLVVAATEATLQALSTLAEVQQAAGVETLAVPPQQLATLEPNIAPDLAGAVFYPQDMQVQPMLAAAQLIAAARRRGARLRTGCNVTGIVRCADGSVDGVLTSQGRIPARIVVNAAGTWGSAVADLADAPVPVLPRRGFILVTEPLPAVIRHKVYTAEYVANVASGSESLQSSTVVEGTRGGTVLIGATRERAGFDTTISWEAVQRIAAGAVSVFPFLARTQALRTYSGFRPYCPDHLPVIGPDPRAPGLFHAVGHEGAGIGLAPASGKLIAQAALGTATELSLQPFSPSRFDRVSAGA